MSFTLQFTDKKLDLIDDVKGVFDQVTGLITEKGVCNASKDGLESLFK